MDYLWQFFPSAIVHYLWNTITLDTHRERGGMKETNDRRQKRGGEGTKEMRDRRQKRERGEDRRESNTSLDRINTEDREIENEGKEIEIEIDR